MIAEKHSGEIQERGRAVSEPDQWRDFHEKFQTLANEELRQRAARTDRFVRAYFTYRKGAEILQVRRDGQRALSLFSNSDKLLDAPNVLNTGIPAHGPFCLIKVPEFGLWALSGGANENFQERFQTVAARAGVALGCLQNTDPVDFWLHRLVLDLRDNKSKLLFADSGEDGMILRACEASAIFCSRLERKALEASLLLPQKNEIEHGQPTREYPEVAKGPALSQPEAWTKLERRGDFIVLAEPSNDTATRIQHDYELLKWNIRKFDQWASQEREYKKQPTLQEAKAVFEGTILVGDGGRVPYLTDHELEDLLVHPQTPSSFAEGILTKRWGFTASTVRTYLRRKHHRKSAKR